MVKELTPENFQDSIDSSDISVLDFWAPWCGPCKQMGPVLDRFAKDNPTINVFKVNVEDHRELAKSYSVRSIPSVFYLKNGEIINQTVGFVDEDKILTNLDL